MPVSSLLITFDPPELDALRAALARDPRVSAGDPVGARLPIALDTPNRQADRAAWDWLRTCPGVRWLDLVWITIEGDDAADWSAARTEPHIRLDGAES